MLRSFFSFARYFVFWLIIFFFSRVTFELYFYNKFKGLSALEVLQTFSHGLWLDYSASAYLCIIPVLVFVVGWFFPNTHVKPIWLKVYTWFFVFAIAFLTILDLGIFTEWGTKVNYRVFNTIYNAPAEAVASSGSSPIASSIIIGVVLLVLGVATSLYVVDFNFKKPVEKIKFKIPVSLLLCFVTFVLIRGGLRGAPLNEHRAYFSNKQILNQAVLNTEWNLMNNVVENLRSPYNPYEYLPLEKAYQIVDSLYTVKRDVTTSILKTYRPNVVIIQLESYTADIIESLGGDKGVAPHFEEFIKNGLFFDHIYAAGDRTDKGIVAILSGFPSQATRTIITADSKQRKLPAISVALKKAGYITSYFYGGESSYMNFDSYIKHHSFDSVIDELSFNKKEIGSKWGAYDGVMFNKNIGFLDRQKHPFFCYVQTLSNHEPFELQGAHHFPGKDQSNLFRSTAWYTDSVLNDYLQKAKKTDWYKNTLFILVADHGHRLPRNTSEAYDPAKYHIPLLFFGDVIKEGYRGKKISLLGNQTDIAATLLAQLKISHKSFEWSKDLLNPYSKQFAFFDWDNGLGFMEPQQSVSYDNEGDKIIFNTKANATQQQTDKQLLKGQAYLQKIFTQYLNY
ncbi:LTA synthase family protein [Mucilaginibacter ginkgonis]|uniref:Sulfatase-like hydrolase/transferase n=1 Tax=Mucilaginibacter ginkgonis TaxID=2682091 RepID=A0A6I4HWS9_9SPHI|nr:alkaline phosphatase family protein [Mucilaginibacter ginkgonis]QQL51294.1 sulfatase-like hydrolase/transferase [Mucilaginibacter ginkgonis]